MYSPFQNKEDTIQAVEPCQKRTISQIRESAAHGCHYCWVLKSYFSPSEITTHLEGGGLELNERLTQIQKALQGHMLPIDLPPTEVNNLIDDNRIGDLLGTTSGLKHVTVPIAEGLQTRNSSHNETPHLSPTSNNSPSCIALLQQWLSACHTSHKTCGNVYSTTNVPARLVDLGIGQSIRPVLRSTDRITEDLIYTTLSHCWGANNILRTLTSNIESFETALPVQKLPPNFRDAMEVTYRLGIRYIWIDSLCILQDSEQDWQLEAPRMSDIYSQSYLNIAATGGSGKDGGLFARRPFIALERCEVNWGSDFIHDMHMQLSSRWDLEFQKSPLRSRAWAVQELLLAPRTVYFCADQMFWECDERNANEMFPDEVPKDGHKGKMCIYPYSESDPDASKSDAVYYWTHIVARYSQGNLTFRNKDKLIAIAGLAKVIGLPLEEYLAGLWRSSLFQQLSWEVDHAWYLLPDPETPSVPRRDAIYRAPSWSWASVNGPVLFSNNLWRFVPPLRSITVLDIHIELIHEMDLTGQIRFAFLRLACHLAAAELPTYTYFMENYIKGCTANLTTGKPPFIATWKPARDIPVNAPEIKLNLDEGPKDGIEGNMYYFLPLTEENLSHGPEIVGIVIEPTGCANGEYQRIGRFEVTFDQCWDEFDSCSAFWDLCRHFDQNETDENLWESRHFDEQEARWLYTIKLV